MLEQSPPSAAFPAARGRIGDRPSGRDVLTAALWLVALATVGLMAHEAYAAYQSAPDGFGDFAFFLHAARSVAAGHSPYENDRAYVYPPLLALLLEPVSHDPALHLWQAWLVAMLTVPLIGIGAFVFSKSFGIAGWIRPLFFAACAFTLLDLHFWPLARDVRLGQSDTITLAVLLVSTYAADRLWPAARAVLLGIAALLKGWPALLALCLFQRRLERRKLAIIVFVVVIALAPVMAVAFGGASGLVAFFKNVVDARRQPYLNESVWQTSQMLFAHNDYGRPLVISSVLQIGLELELAGWVALLLVLTLRTPGDPAMCTWNVALCVVMVLPVSHRQYAMYALPLLWLWAARLLQARRLEPRLVAMVAVMVGWWLIHATNWPYSDTGGAYSSVRVCAPLAADIIACTASVLLARAMAGSRVPNRRLDRGIAGSPVAPQPPLAPQPPVAPQPAAR